MKDILAEICCLKIIFLHLQDLKTWGCYGWIVTLQEFLEMKSRWGDWPFECNIAKFWPQSQSVKVYNYLIRVDKTFQYGFTGSALLDNEWRQFRVAFLIYGSRNFVIWSRLPPPPANPSSWGGVNTPSHPQLQMFRRGGGGGISWWEERLLSKKIATSSLPNLHQGVQESWPKQAQVSYFNTNILSSQKFQSSNPTSTKLSLQAFKVTVNIKASQTWSFLINVNLLQTPRYVPRFLDP